MVLQVDMINISVLNMTIILLACLADDTIRLGAQKASDFKNLGNCSETFMLLVMSYMHYES